jgi:hypothetical protein
VLCKRIEYVAFLVPLLETGKGGVGGYSTHLESAHMVKSCDKNR